MQGRVAKREGDSDDEYLQREWQETIVKVQWWQVMLVIFAVFGFIFNMLYTHGERLTVLETDRKGINESLTRIEQLAKDTNRSMHEHIENGRR